MFNRSVHGEPLAMPGKHAGQRRLNCARCWVWPRRWAAATGSDTGLIGYGRNVGRYWVQGPERKRNPGAGQALERHCDVFPRGAYIGAVGDEPALRGRFPASVVSVAVAIDHFSQDQRIGAGLETVLLAYGGSASHHDAVTRLNHLARDHQLVQRGAVLRLDTGIAGLLAGRALQPGASGHPTRSRWATSGTSADPARPPVGKWSVSNAEACPPCPQSRGRHC